MAVPFDHIATYDSLFTRSIIGQLQRKQVWRYLQKITPQLKGLEILELNCGSGEDAMLFSEKGVNLVATDISEEMLKVTVQRANQFSMQNRISSQFLDPESFDETVFDKKFDLIFSNFGGLNCIQPESVKRLLNKIPSILAPGGRFVGVVMPKFCFTESMYLLMTFRFGQVFRRSTSKEVMLELPGGILKSWYYSPSQIRRWSGEKLRLIRTLPVGFATPPAYLEPSFADKKSLLFRLSRWGKRFDQVSIFSGISDHYLIDLQLK
ncbi:MAG TPA: methyltransferase domain-containing protein [Chryseolinea sp.]|nr:methyltransferase domain-containing protein [Chryseolinea sp.]